MLARRSYSTKSHQDKNLKNLDSLRSEHRIRVEELAPSLVQGENATIAWTKNATFRTSNDEKRSDAEIARIRWWLTREDVSREKSDSISLRIESIS